MNITVDRRMFLKQSAFSAAATTAATLVPGVTFAKETTVANDGGITWNKAPCRFCGVGCGLLIGTSGGRAVAVKGDPASPVNKA